MSKSPRQASTARPSSLNSRCARLEQELTQLKQRLDLYEAQAASESFFAQIFNQASQFMALLDLNGKLLNVNQAMLDFMGVMPLEVLKLSLEQLPWWIDPQKVGAWLQQGIVHAAAGQSIEREISVQGQGNRCIVLEFCLKPLWDQSGRIRHLLMEGRDVTKRKQIQLETQRLNVELEQRLAEQTIQLEHSSRQREEALLNEKQAQQQTESAQVQIQLYANIFENLPVGLSIWHPDDPIDPTSLRLVTTNPAATQLTGIPFQDYVGQRIDECFPTLIQNHADLDLYQSVVWSGQTIEKHDVSYATPGMGEATFHIKVFPLPDQSIGIVFENITERKRERQALQESERRYAALARISPVGIFRCDAQGSCLYVNDRWCQMAGISPDAAYGAGWLKAIHPEDRERLWAEWQQSVRGDRMFRSEYRFQRADGSVVWVVGEATPETTEQNEILGFVGGVTDITDRKLAEMAMQESEERFRATFDQAAVGIAHVSLDGHWMQVNNRLCEIVGYSREELLQTTFQAITYPDDLEADLKWVNRLIAGEISTYSMEKRYIHKNGMPTWVNLTVSIIRDVSPPKEGQISKSVPKYMVSVVEDINARKRAEIALQERAQELSQLNTVLTRTTALLEERNRELDRFAYVASHDLKAPLRAIANLSEWIEEDLDGQLPEENQQQLSLLRTRVHRMEALINGLLEYSRAGRTQTTISTISVTDLLNEIIDSLDPPSSFEIQIQPELPTFTTRGLLLRQVFANLISNAIKHHDRPDGRIQVTAEDKGWFYEFSVCDDGPGIASEHHDRIFGIFQTLMARDVKESTGIGLSIVKKIVETEGGKITLESESGQGTTFRFTWLKQPKQIAGPS